MQELVEKDQHQMGFRHYLFRMYKHNADLRNRKFNLTFDEFNSIIKQSCYYCGEPPRPATYESLKARGNTKQPTIYYNGIDRLDPNGNYDKDNVVACCPVCNYMKHVYTKDEFFNHIIKIYNYQNLGSTTISKESTPLIANEWWKRRTPDQKEDLDEDIVSTSTEMQSSSLENVLCVANTIEDILVQESQRVQNELAIVKAEAEKKIVAAQAEKEANELRTKALTPAILQQQWIEKWDGTLPKVVTSDQAGLMLNLPK